MIASTTLMFLLAQAAVQTPPVVWPTLGFAGGFGAAFGGVYAFLRRYGPDLKALVSVFGELRSEIATSRGELRSELAAIRGELQVVNVRLQRVELAALHAEPAIL